MRARRLDFHEPRLERFESGISFGSNRDDHLIAGIILIEITREIFVESRIYAFAGDQQSGGRREVAGRLTAT